QELDAPGQRPNDRVLAAHHRPEIERDLADFDAVLGERMLGLNEPFRGLQQRLRWNAADVEAGSTEAVAAFDAGDGEPELCRADCRDTTRRPCPDNDNIVAIGHGAITHISNKIRGGSSTPSLPRTRNVTASRPSTMR